MINGHYSCTIRKHAIVFFEFLLTTKCGRSSKTFLLTSRMLFFVKKKNKTVDIIFIVGSIVIAITRTFCPRFRVPIYIYIFTEYTFSVYNYYTVCKFSADYIYVYDNVHQRFSTFLFERTTNFVLKTLKPTHLING